MSTGCCDIAGIQAPAQTDGTSETLTEGRSGLQRMCARRERGIDRAHIGTTMTNPKFDFAGLVAGLTAACQGSGFVSKYTFLLFSVAGSLVLCSGEVGGQTPPPRFEEIRVVRSIRLSRMPPTEFCSQSRTTFASAQYEDSFSFAAVATRSADGLVTDAVSTKIGSGHACFGPAADPGAINLYLEVDLGGIRFVGVGKCTRVRSDFPEPDLGVFSCFANLSGLPEPYVGGLLTTNSINSRQPLGAESEPPGYVQASIATVRLWKRREARSP